MENWYQKSIDALQLNGMSNRTQTSYTRAVRLLTEHYDKTPDLITEDELQDYLLHRRNISKWAPNTMRICYAGIRFFFENVLRRDWHILGIIRAQTEYRLPTVLSTEEVRDLLAKVRYDRQRTFLCTVYSCGLRLDEARHLEIGDIDSSRMMIHIHHGKGAKDRYVPLPHATLALLRKHWAMHKNPRLIFPSRVLHGKKSDSQIPVAITTVRMSIQKT